MTTQKMKVFLEPAKIVCCGCGNALWEIESIDRATPVRTYECRSWNTGGDPAEVAVPCPQYLRRIRLQFGVIETVNWTRPIKILLDAVWGSSESAVDEARVE